MHGGMDPFARKPAQCARQVRLCRHGIPEMEEGRINGSVQALANCTWQAESRALHVASSQPPAQHCILRA